MASEPVMPWSRAAKLAACSMSALTAVALGLIFFEEIFVRENELFQAVVIIVAAAFLLAPLPLGLWQRSARVGVLALLLGLILLPLTLLVCGWAYVAIGGGP
jgi:hypothetical protein